MLKLPQKEMGLGPGASTSCLKQDGQGRVSDEEGEEGMCHTSVKSHRGAGGVAQGQVLI